MGGKIIWDQQGERNQAISLLTWGKSEALLIMQEWGDEVIFISFYFIPRVRSDHLHALGHRAALKRIRGPKIRSNMLSCLVFWVSNPEFERVRDPGDFYNDLCSLYSGKKKTQQNKKNH